MNKRINYIDVAKALGIICVCIGHSGPVAIILNFIYQFHMALFFFIGGLLYKDIKEVTLISKIKKAFKSYYLPYVIYTSVYLILHNLFVSLHLVNATNGTGKYTFSHIKTCFYQILICDNREFFAGALWFLWCLLFIYLGFSITDYILSKFTKGSIRLILLLLITVGCVYAGNHYVITNRWKLNTTLTAVLFYYAGYIYNKLNINSYICKYKYYIILITFTVVLYISTHNKVEMSQNSYENFYLFLISSFSGILLIIMLSQLSIFENSSVLRTIGQSTLEIIALHLFVFKIVSLIIINYKGLPIKLLASYPVIHLGEYWWILYTIYGIAIPVMFSKILKNITNFKVKISLANSKH